MNVSNVPLQQLDCEVKQPQEVLNFLPAIRNGVPKDPLLSLFKDKLKPIIKNDKLKYLVVCGEVAKKYFDESVASFCPNDAQIILKRIVTNELEILYMPHPSYNQWQFIQKYQDNLATL